MIAAAACRALLVVALRAWCVPGQNDAAPPLLLEHGRVLDATGEHWLADHSVLIREGRIVAIAPTEVFSSGTIEVPPGSSRTVPDAAPLLRIDLAGRALVPGLIDLHTHLLLHPYDEAPWEQQVLKESLELRTVRATVAAQATLAAGFTTIRDLGTEGAGFADVGLRDAIAAGIIPGPRIFATTRAIVATGCYGPSGFDPRFELPQGAQEADGADGIRVAVREQIAAGADWIKLYADYRRRPGEDATPTFNLDELRAAVGEAKRAGRRVAVHATTDAGIAAAVQAGAATIEHGDGASDKTLRAMQEKKVVLCPTLAAVEALALQSGWKATEAPPARLARAMEMTRRALAIGVTIACGSDAGVFAHGTNAREFELLVACGMTPAQALAAGTGVAATCLRRERDLGRIAPEAYADLVAFDDDPLEDISALRRPRLVIKEGRVVSDQRGDGTPTGRVSEQAEVVAFCHHFLERYSAGDFAAVEQTFLPGAIITMNDVAEGRTDALPAADFITRARERRGETSLREWFTAEPIALVDASIATVWAPFRVEVGDYKAFGIDVFQLLRKEGAWRIVSLGWTSRHESR